MFDEDHRYDYVEVEGMCVGQDSWYVVLRIEYSEWWSYSYLGCRVCSSVLRTVIVQVFVIVGSCVRPDAV